MNDTHSIFGDADIISTYTRAQAIADGVLVDVTATANEVRFRYPVAMTAEAYARFVAWTDKDSDRQVPQDESGRLWDVIYMAALKAKRTTDDQFLFQFYYVPRGKKAQRPKLSVLKMMCGPDDDGNPVLTIMLPSED